jgi:predicted ATPase/DNA-binding SARP family transcriptional activator
MQFGILGPLEVLHDGVRLQLGGVRRRAVLARLLLDVGRPVSADRLIDDVWADEPPATARKNLQKYVLELRRLLTEPVLTTVAGGYLLDVTPDQVDARRFERLTEAGEYDAALGLWRGEVLADLSAYGFVAAERVRLGELRFLAQQGRIEQNLASGEHERAVAELAEAVDAHPHRERLVELYMLALYRSGRQGEALGAFRAYRDRLADELGVEPGARVRELQVSILRQEPDLQPPPVTAWVPRTARSDGNLPRGLTSFVGRESELDALAQRLADNRLVTVTGPGGIGKTRLALEMAHRSAAAYDEGAWLVDLAEVGADEQVPAAVAAALRCDARHAPDVLTAIEGRLSGSGTTLAILDNCEHVVVACADLLRRILRSCPGVTVLATSRRPVGVEGEYVLPLSSLRDEDCVQLFVDRARRTGQLADDGWTAREVSDLCRRLDGLPLAIELAASQLRVLSLAELAAHVDERLTFHGTGERSSPRQGSLQDMVAWSHSLLPGTAQRVFARCGVFLGSLSLAGAEAVCADLGLGPAELRRHVTTLVDHSLLLRIGDGGTDSRYRLLETLRLFAIERLAETGELDEIRRAHAAYLRDVADEAGRRVHGPDERIWHGRIEVEAPNLETALAWAAAHDWCLAVDLAVALWPYWDAGWGERAAVAYLEGLLAQPPRDDHRLAWAYMVAADMAANQGDARKSVPWARRAVRMFDNLPDGQDDERGRCCSLVALGAALGSEGTLEEAAAVLAEATEIADRLGDDTMAARSLNRRHFVAARQGDHAAAEEWGRQELARWARVGSARGEATALRHLAVTAYRFGELDRAHDLCERALKIWREVEDPAAVAHVHTTLGDIANERGETSRATALYRAALVDLQAVGDRRCEASTCKNLAGILAADDAHEQSARLYRDGIALRHELGDQAGLAECFEGLAGSLRALSCEDQAATLLGAAAALRSTHRSVPTDAEHEVVERLRSDTRQELGPGRFETSFRRGQALALDEIVELALDDHG